MRCLDEDVVSTRRRVGFEPRRGFGKNKIKFLQYSYQTIEDLQNAPEGNEIAFIRKCHDTFAILLRDWEQIFKDIPYAFAKLRAEPLKDEMRILFRHSRVPIRGNVMAQLDVMQRAEQGRSMWEVRDNHSVGRASMLVQDDQVRDVVCSARLSKLLHDVVSTIDPVRVWEDKAHFFRELKQL